MIRLNGFQHAFAKWALPLVGAMVLVGTADVGARSTAIVNARQDERGEVFRWFDTLGHKAVLDGPFIEIDSWWEENGGKEHHLPPAIGFLISGEAPNPVARPSWSLLWRSLYLLGLSWG